MEQNPYSAPQTTLDYIEKRPLKQRIKRVLLSAFGVSALSAVLTVILSVTSMVIFYEYFKGLKNPNFSILGHIFSIDSFMVALLVFACLIIPTILLMIILEKTINHITGIILTIYAVIGGLLCALISDITQFFIGSKRFGTLWYLWYVKNLKEPQDFSILLTVIMMYLSCIIATLIITLILKAKSKNTFQAA